MMTNEEQMQDRCQGGQDGDCGEDAVEVIGNIPFCGECAEVYKQRRVAFDALLDRFTPVTCSICSAPEGSPFTGHDQ